MFLSISLLALASLVSSQGTCGPDVSCLAQLSQYVVIGTVVSNTKNDPMSSPTNYSATINVKCALLSFSSTGPDRGDNLVGRNIDVSKFGGNNKCEAVNEADVGATRIFFVAVRTLRPVAGQTINYEVVDICVGGLENSDANLLELGKVMKSYPENLIPAENRGTDPMCSAVATAVNNTGEIPKPNSRVPTSSASAIVPFAGLLLFVMFAM